VVAVPAESVAGGTAPRIDQPGQGATHGLGCVMDENSKAVQLALGTGAIKQFGQLLVRGYGEGLRDESLDHLGSCLSRREFVRGGIV
jgi:hypothetical protein